MVNEVPEEITDIMQKTMGMSFAGLDNIMKKQVNLTIQFVINDHLITVQSMNPAIIATIEKLKLELQKALKTKGKISYIFRFTDRKYRTF